jgi:L-arabinokinase
LTSILYFITGHGYGHAVRSSQVIAALRKIGPEVRVHVRTSAPRWLFPRGIGYTYDAIDIGLMQRDSLSMDLSATARECRALLARAEEIIERGCAFVRSEGVKLIAGDIPALAFAIAKRAGIPSVAIANFIWSGIYSAYVEEFPEFSSIIEQMNRYYGEATLALALPYAFALDPLPLTEPIPWIARRSKLDKAAARTRYGIPEDSPVVLLSFGGLGFDHLPWERLKRMRNYFFVATGARKCHDGNVLVLPGAQRRYQDLLRAVDALVTKPGYGIVTDAIAHRVRVLYTDRGEFPEYEHLVGALRDCATAEYIPQGELLSGNIQPFLSRLLEKPAHWPEVKINGADVAAQKLLALAQRF